MKRYNHVTDTIDNLGTISPDTLIDIQKTLLSLHYRVSWDLHAANGCEFECANMGGLVHRVSYLNIDKVVRL